MIEQSMLDAKNCIGMIREESLSKLLIKIDDNDFAIITGWKPDERSDNFSNKNEETNSYFYKHEMNGYHIVGHWQKTRDSVEWENASLEEKTNLVEDCIMLVRNPTQYTREEFINVRVGIYDEYKLDTVMVGLYGDSTYLYRKVATRESINILSNSTLGKIEQAYSKIRGKENVPFVFEGMLTPINNISRMGFKLKNLRWL